MRRGRTGLLLTAIAAVLCTIPAPPAQGATVPPGHTVVIFMENHSLSYITGHPALVPYQYSLWNGTASTPAEDMTTYTKVTTSSLPNYLAFASGKLFTTTGYKAGSFPGPSLWDQLSAAGISWGVYEEGMPSVCYPSRTFSDSVTDGQYTLGHNPATPFASIYGTSKCANVQPLSDLDLAALPTVSFITPNICDDMHGVASGSPDPYTNCVTGSAALAQRSDAWLSRLVPQLAAAGATVFITYDEGSSTLFAAETGADVVNGSKFTTATSHYGLLAGIEDAYGLPRLGNAATAAPVPFP